LGDGQGCKGEQTQEKNVAAQNSFHSKHPRFLLHGKKFISRP
jgi:hypothetical protein